jgi:DNA-binding NarL/FixJ family response regulator
MTEPIRVLIADDHPLFRDGLTVLLTDGPDTELVGAATSGTEAVELARETQPDVVVMDLHMPGLNGIEATRRIVADSPHITVLVLTMFDDDDSIFSALRAGSFSGPSWPLACSPTSPPPPPRRRCSRS